MAPAQTSMSNVSLMASRKSGHLLTRFGSSLLMSSCISDHLHTYLIVLHKLQCLVNSV